MHGKDTQRELILKLLEEHPNLGPEAIQAVSEATGIAAADVYGSARFYDLLVRPGARICTGLTCRLKGCESLKAELEANGTELIEASCLGQCDRAPVTLNAEMALDRCGPRGGVTPDNPELPMNLGGEDVADYAALAIAKAKGSDWVIEQLKAGGLQGRGGAGFPAHFKWKAVRDQERGPHYVVLNADEAEPGTFKDRECMLRRPHLVLEGLAIAAHTVGARDIYLYVRGEFAAEQSSLKQALAAASETLAEFDFHVISGHGAYICGEETALLESIEGRRGMPRLKPPYPTEVGLFGKPTLINNVETLACVPAILERGGEWFKAQGQTQPGTKLYCVSGHVNKPGVYELPLGVCLDEVVEAAGGYDGTPIGFVPGGAASGFLPISERTRPMDFNSLTEVESMLGSAGVVVLNDTVDIVRAALAQLQFFEVESCGQCAPCRIGSRYLRQAVERYLAEGDPSALSYIDDVAFELVEGSICGLGITAPLPLTSARAHFPEAFSARQPGESK